TPRAGPPPDAEPGVERERARRDDRDLLQRPAGAEAHDGALAELSLDLRDRQLEGLPPIVLALSHAVAPCDVKVRGPAGIDARRMKNAYAREHRSAPARGRQCPNSSTARIGARPTPCQSSRWAV